MGKLRKCRCCDNLEMGGLEVMDVSNGLSSVPICKECYEDIVAHARAIEDKLKLPLWSVSISMKEHRYEENIKL